MKKFTKVLPFAASLAPVLLLANTANFTYVTTLVAQIQGVVTTLVPLLIAIALLVFIWGVVKFIAASDDSARDDGKKKMIWGIVGLFVIISVWGLVTLLSTLVGVRGVTNIQTPFVP